MPSVGLQVELHEARFTRLVDEAEGVNAEAFHHAQAARDGAVRHHPHEHVQAFPAMSEMKS